jgi:Fic-DOC domain mobile mystery protein B
MGLELNYINGQTPIDEDERFGLKISSITNIAELNEFEQINIQKAIKWTLAKRIEKETLFTEEFICKLHKKMFGEVWKWAGTFRKTNKNIGVDKFIIGTELKNLIDDVKYWIDNQIFEPDIIALRFKHRLVKIHAFPNGNGRHSRLMSDLIISKVFNLPVFSWGSSNLANASDLRTEYINALHEADGNNFNNLIIFARS